MCECEVGNLSSRNVGSDLLSCAASVSAVRAPDPLPVALTHPSLCFYSLEVLAVLVWGFHVLCVMDSDSEGETESQRTPSDR